MAFEIMNRVGRNAVVLAEMNPRHEDFLEGFGFLVIERLGAVAFGGSLKNRGEFDIFSEFVEEIDFIRGRVIEKPEDFHMRAKYKTSLRLLH